VKLVLYLIIHLLCSVMAYGIFFADFQGITPPAAAQEYRRLDQGAALFFSLLGPLSLLFAFLISGAKHGLKFK
jgi:hypothetical protein